MKAWLETNFPNKQEKVYLKWLTHLDDYDIDDPTDIPKFSDQSWTALNLPSLLKDSLATLRGSSLATSLSANSHTATYAQYFCQFSWGEESSWSCGRKLEMARHFHRGFTRLQPPTRKERSSNNFCSSFGKQEIHMHDWVCLLPSNAVANLFVICYYYRRFEQSNRYAYDTSWNTPVEISAVICPVVVSYHQEDKTFSICQDHVDLAQQSVAGVEHI